MIVDAQRCPARLACGRDLELGHACAAGIVALRFPCRRKSGMRHNVWMDDALLIHPTHWGSWRDYLDAVLLASSLPNSVANTCFAFPTCGTALA